MQLTRAADYAVRVMMYLASLPARRRVSRRELAHAADVPEAFMGKILQRLVGSRLVVSHRGRGGGFELGLPADDISMLDIVSALEGPLALNICLLPGDLCPHRSKCAAHPVWVEAQARVADVLAAASLSRLARASGTRRGRGKEGAKASS